MNDSTTSLMGHVAQCATNVFHLINTDRTKYSALCLTFDEHVPSLQRKLYCMSLSVCVVFC